MGFRLFSCCTSGNSQAYSSEHEKRDVHLANVANVTTFNRPAEANPVSKEPFQNNLTTIVQELLVRLPQVAGRTWIDRLETGISLLSSVTDVDAVSIALVVPGEKDGTAVPYAILCGGGTSGPQLQHFQQEGYKAALSAAARSGDEPSTSMHMIANELQGDILLLSSETVSRGDGDSTYNRMCSTGALVAGENHIRTCGVDVDLPLDWAAVAAASNLRHFCGLALRIGSRLLAVITLAWETSYPVPPGLRTRRGGTGRIGPSGTPQLTSPLRESAANPTAATAVAGCPAGAPAAAASEVEVACLLQLSQVFSLGLFSDPSNVLYGQKVARMIHVMDQAANLQETFDGLLVGVRDILLHRFQQELVPTLALKHTTSPTAAFILETRPGGAGPLLSPLPSLQPRGSTVSGHVTAPPASAPQRSLHPAIAGAAVSTSLPPNCAAQGQVRALQSIVAGLNHPSQISPSKAQITAGGSVAASHSNAVALPGRSVSNNNGMAMATQNPVSIPPGVNTTASNLPSGGGSIAGAAGSGRVSVSSHFHRLRPVDSRAGAGASGGGAGGSSLPVSGMLRHAMSVDLGGFLETDCTMPYTVHAHITSMADTLFMASLSMGTEAADDTVAGRIASRTAGAAAAAAGGAEAATATLKRELGGCIALPGRAVGVSGRTIVPTISSSAMANAGGSGSGLPGMVPGTVTYQGSVIPNCHLLVQDESLPCRDLVLVQKLVRMPVQSLVLVVIRPNDVLPLMQCLPYTKSSTPPQTHHATPPNNMAASAGTDSIFQSAAPSFSASMPSFGLYLSSPDPLSRSALQGVMMEAREAMRFAADALYRRLTHGSLQDEWNGLMEAMSTTPSAGRMSYASSRMVSLHRPRSSNMLQEQASGNILQYSIVNNPSRVQLGTSPGVLSSELSKPLVRRLVVDSLVEQPLQQLDAMVSSIQSTLSAVQLQLDVPGGGGDMHEVRLNDIAAVELMEIIGRGGQGVVFRGLVHGIEAAAKVISHRDEADDVASKSMPAVATTTDRRATGGGGGGGPAALESPLIVDEARMRERKRNLLRDALELAVTITISHPNIVQMYGYFTDCVVVQYANIPNRLKLLPVDNEALQQYGGQRGPVNTVMCMEFCDAGTLKSVAEGGAFRLPGVSAKSGPACPALAPLYTSLLEVALALRHLHGRRLVHCDLKPSNILLKSSLRDPRGWICKLSDFGCVRVMNEEGEDGRLGFRQPQPLGTLTHMAPEMFVRGGLLDAGIDIYAFGIIMWELIMVAPVYDGTVPKEKLPSMVRRGLRPIFHPLVPPEYRTLAIACWQEDPRRRPSAAVLVSTLQRLLVKAQAAASSTGAISTNIKSSSFSGIGVAHAGDVDVSMANGGGGGGGSGGGNLRQRQVYDSVQRRNTVTSNLGVPVGSPGGLPAGNGPVASAASPNNAGSSQRQAFPLPVPSPLSRETSSSVRAAVRQGDGGGTKSAARNLESTVLSPGQGVGNDTPLSPLSTGLGASPPPAAVQSTSLPAAATAAATSAAVAAAITSVPERGLLSSAAGPLDDAMAGSGAASVASAAVDAAAVASGGVAGSTMSAMAAARFMDARASSLLGIGNASVGEKNAQSSSASGVAATAVTATAVTATAGRGSAPGAVLNHVPVANTDSETIGASEVTLPVRASVFPTGSVALLTGSTAEAAHSGELVGL
ncbi:hypothetical protein VaNZ11_002145 [Volvox africanus]|uniref:Protein kinase domain-containing protein n=1 Tax=Volvox africanus TaxID=51714 RepID=A0ABQ5RS76_9CHLO|nr:hypothetical protein VaNZ11_002145 [Volvox africanus]